MNLKHEMFWNISIFLPVPNVSEWTLNMKCFEISSGANARTRYDDEP